MQARFEHRAPESKASVAVPPLFTGRGGEASAPAALRSGVTGPQLKDPESCDA